MLELACGGGESLIWLEQKGARELWGLDISAAQIKRSERLFKEKGKKAKLFVSPMELNPSLQHSQYGLTVRFSLCIMYLYQILIQIEKGLYL